MRDSLDNCNTQLAMLLLKRPFDNLTVYVKDLMDPYNLYLKVRKSLYGPQSNCSTNVSIRWINVASWKEQSTKPVSIIPSFFASCIVVSAVKRSKVDPSLEIIWPNPNRSVFDTPDAVAHLFAKHLFVFY